MSESSDNIDSVQCFKVDDFLKSESQENDGALDRRIQLNLFMIPEIKLDKYYLSNFNKLEEEYSFTMVGIVASYRKKLFLTSQMNLNNENVDNLPDGYVGYVSAREGDNYFFGDHIDLELKLEPSGIFRFLEAVKYAKGTYFGDIYEKYHADIFMSRFYHNKYLPASGVFPIEFIAICYYNSKDYYRKFYIKDIKISGIIGRNNFIKASE